MFRTGFAVARGLDAGEAATRALDRALAQNPTPQLAILFADVAYDPDTLLATIRDRLGNVPVWGTTSPLLVSNAGMERNAVQLLLVTADAFEFTVLSARADDPAEAARYLGSKYLLDRKPGPDDRLACLLAGTEKHTRGLDYLAGLRDVFPRPLAVSGGATVGRFPAETIGQMHDGAQFCGSIAGRDRLSLLFLKARDAARAAFGFAYECRFTPIAEPAVCTRAEGNVVYEINGIPAFSYMKLFFGADFETSLEHIRDRYNFLALFREGGEVRPLVRAPHYDLERGAIWFWPNEPMQGLEIQMIHISRDELVATAGAAARQAKAGLAGARPELVLVFDCLNRAKMLHTLADEEIRAIRSVFGDGVPIAGFYSAGEYAPIYGDYAKVCDPALRLSGSGQFGCTISIFALGSRDEAANEPRDFARTLAADRSTDLGAAALDPAMRARDLEEKLAAAEQMLSETERSLKHINREHFQLGLALKAANAGLGEANARTEKLTEVLRRYTPENVWRKASATVHAGLLRIPDEELLCALLFMDIKGFTTYAERHAPEDVIAEINRIFAPATDAIYARGGDVDKYIGDCIFATFDAPDAAVEAGLDAQRLLAGLRAAGSPFALRVGIHYGRVVSGNVGSARRSDNTLIGDAVNLAQRLESNCAPGRVLVSEVLFGKLSPAFRERLAVRRDTIVVKGKEIGVGVVEIDPAGAPPASATGPLPVTSVPG